MAASIFAVFSIDFFVVFVDFFKYFSCVVSANGIAATPG